MIPVNRAAANTQWLHRGCCGRTRTCHRVFVKTNKVEKRAERLSYFQAEKGGNAKD